MSKHATHLIAFLSSFSKGTRDMIKRAQSRRLKIKIYKID